MRLAHPQTRLEAVTSRPLWLSGVARLTHHAGQARLSLTLLHAAGDQIKAMIADVRKGIDTILATAPQLPQAGRWRALVRYIIDPMLRLRPKNQPPSALLTSHSPFMPTG